MKVSITLRTYATPELQEQSILDTAEREFATVGVRRANMDEVAKAAGVSRSTLYRRFANKDVLLAAVVERTMRAFYARVATVTRGQTPKGAVVEAFCESIRQARDNPLMRKLAESAPGPVQALMGIGGPEVEARLSAQAKAIAERLGRAGAQMPREDLRIASELMLRIVTSLVHTGSRLIDIDDDDEARAFATKFLAPLVW